MLQQRVQNLRKDREAMLDRITELRKQLLRMEVIEAELGGARKALERARTHQTEAQETLSRTVRDRDVARAELARERARLVEVEAESAAAVEELGRQGRRASTLDKRVHQLETRMAVTSESYKHACRERDEAAQQLARAEHARRDAKAKCAVLDARVEELETELEGRVRECNEFSRKLDSSREAERSGLAAKRELEAERDCLLERCAAMDVHKVKLEAALKGREGKARELQQRLEKLIREGNQSEVELARLQASHGALMLERTTLIADGEAQRAELDQVSSLAATLKTKCNRLSATLADTERVLASCKQERDGLSRKVADLRKRVAAQEAVTKRAEEDAAAKASQSERLAKQLAAVAEEAAALKTRGKQLGDELVELERTSKRSELQAASAERELVQRREQVDALQRALEQCRSDKTRLERASQQRERELESNAQQLQVKCDRLVGELHGTKALAEKRAETIRELEGSSAELRAKLADAESAMEEELGKLRAEVQESQREVWRMRPSPGTKELQQEVELAQAERDDEHRQRQQAEAKLRDVTAQLAVAHREKTVAEAQAAKAVQSESQCVERLQALEGEAAKGREELEEVQAQLQAAGEREQEAQEEIRELRQALRGRESEIAELLLQLSSRLETAGETRLAHVGAPVHADVPEGSVAQDSR